MYRSIAKRGLTTLSPLLAACFVSGVPMSAVRAQELEEIVVTAEKREQRLFEVPLAVSALTAKGLASAGVTDLTDIELLMPSLIVTQNSALVATAFTTRGIGVNGNIPYFEPSTALFIDGAYRSRSSLGMDDLVNIERIEVLNGPQTTVYGKNATAGVVSIHTARPRAAWGGFVELTPTLSDVGEAPFGVALKGDMSGPVSDSIGVGASFTYRDRGDEMNWTGSPLAGSQNGAREYTVRGQLEVAATDFLSVRVTGGHTDRDHNGIAPEMYWDDAAVNGLLAQLEGANTAVRLRQSGVDLDAAGAPTGTNASMDALIALGVTATPAGVSVIPPTNDRFDRSIHMDAPYTYELSADDATLDASLQLANGWTLNSLTSYNAYQAEQVELDVDQTVLDLGVYSEPQDGNTITQELRLSSPKGERYEWMIGVFYLRDRLDRAVRTRFGEDAPLVGLGIDGDVAQFEGFANTDNVSGFGQLLWHANDEWSLTAGARVVYEDKQAGKFNSSFNGSAPASPVFHSGAFASVFDPLDSGTGSRNTTGITYSLSVSYQPSPDLLFYARQSRGFKPGGFNVVWGPVGPGDADFEYDDEAVAAYEVGSKGRILDGRVQLSAAMFYQEHEDYQTAAYLGTIFNLSNAERAITEGIEAEIAWAATDAMTLSTTFTVMDAHYSKFTNGPCHALATPGADGYCDLSGESLPYAANFSGRVTAQYEFPLPASSLVARTDVSFSGDYNPDLVLAPFFEEDGYVRANVRLGWETSRFDVAGFINNVTDETIVDWTGAVNLIGGTTSGQFIVSPGRTYGMTANVKF